LSLVFSCLGHAYMHLFGAFYFVMVLALESEWNLPYHELVELWTPAALMIGLMALPAGWLADRWSTPGMMIVMFLGLGATAILSGLADTPSELRWCLAGIGVFAAIYHPVGVAWVVRTSASRGRALGLNGVFGSFGIAASGIVTGTLIDVAGWRTAFLIPGCVSVLTGLVALALLWSGAFADRRHETSAEAEASRQVMMRGFGFLIFIMGIMAIVTHATQIALPKLFELRMPDLVGTGTRGVGTVVAVVYVVSGATQILGGYLADRVSLKGLYVSGLLLLVPVQFFIAELHGAPLFVAATLGAFLGTGVLPAENMLLARFSPARHHGVAYAAKFVVAFCAAPVAVQMVAWIQERTGSFEWLFLSLAAFVAVAVTSAFMIPADRG